MRHDGGMPETSLRRTPEDDHLADQERLLEELTDLLSTREMEFATKGVEFARFRAAYLTKFAPLYAELDRLEAEVARILAERFDEIGVEATAARTEADEAEARASESASAAESAETQAEPNAEPTRDLKSLYRQVAKTVHPDLASDDAERARRTRLMAAAGVAYVAGDDDALQRILDGEAARPEAIVGDDIGARLVRTLRRISQVRARLAELVELHASLEGDEMWTLFATVRDATTKGEDPLGETEHHLRSQIRSARARLAALRAKPRGA
jgi:hypothetical protein